MIEGECKGVTVIENGTDVLPEQDNVLDDGVGVFLQEFIQNLALFRRQVLVIGKEQVTLLPQLLVQSFSNFGLGRLSGCGLEVFAVGGQGFV